MMIIPSGKPKIWDKYPELGAQQAKVAYTGTFHRLCKQYAEMREESFLILSPKYGFLTPEDEVPKTYDVRFTYKGVTNDTISLLELQNQWQKLEIKQPEIVMLGGKKFKGLLKEIAPSQLFVFPLVGSKGIGDMQQKLKAAIQNKRAL